VYEAESGHSGAATPISTPPAKRLGLRARRLERSLEGLVLSLNG